MAILVYAASQIHNDLSSHGLPARKLTEFIREIEDSQSLERFDKHYPHPCLVKSKWYDYNNRLIATRRPLRGHQVVILLRVLIRSSAEYRNDFWGDPTGYIDRQLSSVDSQELIDWVDQRTRIDPPCAPPQLSESEKHFLWSPAYPETLDDVIICETHEWVNNSRDSSVKAHRIRVPAMIVAGLLAPQSEITTIHSTEDKNLTLQLLNSRSTGQCVLLSLNYGASERALEEIAQKWSAKLQIANYDEILRHCRVAYPSLMLCDESKWMAMHESGEDADNVANLSLSPEEGTILRSCDQYQGRKSGFPLFINGRAGSGKSTLLQYLFAFTFRRWHVTMSKDSNYTNSRPLYLASSRKLLDVAREAVHQVLLLNHNQLLDDVSSEMTSLEHLPSCFEDVTDFMQSLLSDQDKDCFPRAKCINYAKFRRLWYSRFGKDPKAVREYGPQISWHVIRGLIKGLSVNALLERDEYEDLPKDERTISKKTFETVHDKVWTAWYATFRTETDGWDNQDLARHLLTKNLLPRTHVGLFCDEAQDFTRLELEAIYQCSVFSSRTIDMQSLRRIPFVFAGDPFQTLNPTGFRWDSVQAAFTERIVQSLYRFDSGVSVPELHYEELTFNYRSAVRIVFFCNSIQALRAVLFKHTSLLPQKTWRLNDDTGIPVFMDQAEAKVLQALKGQSDLTLIVPCEEGEEADYVQNDPYLNSFVERDDEGIPRNVQSAARSKGLEFNRVGLYGWSLRPEASLIADLIKHKEEIDIPMDTQLALEYFMNNLYVAASRAQRRLFVIDSAQSVENLWWFASDDEPLKAIASRLGSALWSDNVGPLIKGGIDNFKFDQDSNLKMAQRYESEGLSRSAAYTLKQAAMYYDLVPDSLKAHECRANAYSIGGRHLDAGTAFELAELPDKAVDSYWHGQLFGELTELAEKKPELGLLPQCQVAEFLCDKSSTAKDAEELIQRLIAIAKQDPGFHSALQSNSWKDCVEKILRHVLSQHAADVPSIRSMCSQLHILSQYGLHVSIETHSDLYFAAQQFEKVMQLLGHEKGGDRFREAEALLFAGKLDDGEQLDSIGIRKVAEFEIRQKRYHRASELFRRAEEPDRVLECLRRQVQESKSYVQEDVVLTTYALESLIAGGQWELLADLCLKGAPGKLDKGAGSWTRESASIVQQHLREGNLVIQTVVPGLAVSTLLPLAPPEQKKHVEELLGAIIREWQEGRSQYTQLDPQVLGAAVERAGKDIQALSLYERIRESANSPSEKQYAEYRWVICKMRQAAREERDGFDGKAASHRRSANEVMRRYGWGQDSIRDEFPSLDHAVPLDSSTEAPQKQTPRTDVSKSKPTQSGSLGPLDFRYVAAKGWINIDSQDGMRARVLMGPAKLPTGDVAFVASGENEFACSEWALRVTWITGKKIRFERAGEMIELSE